MKPYDNDILQEISNRLADLGVRENERELIRDVARQWARIVPEGSAGDQHRPQPAEPVRTQRIRARPMRVLIVSYRFDSEIAGGAELHTWMLARELRQAGNEVDVLTTRNRVFVPTSSYGLSWQNNIPRGVEEIDGIRVQRFTTLNLPRFLSRGLSYMIRRRRDWEGAQFSSRIGTGAHLGTGWHDLELWEGETLFRWTARREATIIFPDENILGLSMEVFCPYGVQGSLEIGTERQSFDVAPGDWKGVTMTCEPRTRPCAMLRVNRLWKARNDPRPLGLAVKNIRYKVGLQWQELPMDRDLGMALGELDGEGVVELYREIAGSRPRIYDWLCMLARGPLAPALYASVYRQLPQYDAVIANMVPFDTLCFTAWAGKQRGVPVLLLPLMHHRDHYHHWGHFYRAMERSAAILANSRFSERLFQRLGYKAMFAGAGVDEARYTKSGISGERFRSKFRLGATAVALFVGRKIRSKRYDMAVEAVDLANGAGRDIRLVMIGPDEDGAPVRSPHVLFLGKVSSDELLDAYDACNVFVLPSELESFGMVYLEAWMRKKPVIGLRRCDAVASLIDDGVDGFLCNNAEEIAQRILYLLDNPQEARRMGERGFQKTMEHHTWESVGRRVVEILERVCGAAPFETQQG